MFQDNEKITGNQALMLVLAGGIGNIFIVLATPAVLSAGRDGWLPVMLAYTIATIIGLILINLGSRFPDKTFVQYLPIVLGKPLGKIVGLFYIVGFWVMTALIVKESVILTKLFLPFTPPIFINIMFCILIVYVMKKGFMVYARTAEIFSVTMVVFIILILCLITPNIEWKNLTPVLENGFVPTMKALPVQIAYAMETVLFMALWFPCLNDRKKASKAVLLGIPISGILLTVLVAMNIAFTGSEILIKQIYPVFYMSRYILIAEFVKGFEALFMTLWLSTAYLELLVFFYPPVVGLAQWFNLKNYKPLILPMTVSIMILAMIPVNVVEVIKLDTLKNPYVILPMGFTIPIVWLIAWIRKLDESKSPV